MPTDAHCVDCGKDISHTHANRQRCDECRQIRNFEKHLETREIIVARECVDCNKLMVHTPGIALSNKRCSECNIEYRRERARIFGQMRANKRKKIKKPSGHCIDCGKEFDENAPGNKLRCGECKKKNRNKVNNERFHSILRVSVCNDCGKDIGERGSKSYRCAECQHEYNNKKRRDERTRKREKLTRLCKQCGEDISHRVANATICWSCRRKNAERVNKKYYLGHKKEHRLASKKYYDKNKGSIVAKNNQYQKKERKKKKRILDMDLDEPESRSGKRLRSDLWVEWDDMPRCEGICLDIKSYNNPFGTQCDLRACYRLKDKYDNTVRFMCGFHLKTIGNLKWYHIEKLDLQIAIRRLTKLRWKKMQKEEREKDELKRIKRNEKNKKKKVPMPRRNTMYPIINGNYQDQVLYPSDNIIDEE